MNISITNTEEKVFDTIIIPDEFGEDVIKESFNGFLNPRFCIEFREVINSSPIFAYDPEYTARYNLCCAVMDRLDTCVEKLNTYGEYPDSEEDFLVFMMFASMVTDAVKEILSQLGIHNKREPIYNSDEDYKYFREVYLNSPIYNSEAAIPTDEAFFQHFRALSFAHPIETSRQKFMKKGETQYSPWVIVNRNVMRLQGYEDGVGVRIYTTLSDDILDLKLSFSVLKEYVRSRYERIALATAWAKAQIENARLDWSKTKINRKQLPIDMLHDIDKTLDARYEKHYCIKEAIRYMECSLTDESNASAVNIFISAITDIIPSLCDAVDTFDHNSVEELCDNLFRRPRNLHTMANYQLEKIFCNLNNEHPSDILFGLMQAKRFYEDFANKWVRIDVDNMSHTEIQLLARTACYLEIKQQEQE